MIAHEGLTARYDGRGGEAARRASQGDYGSRRRTRQLRRLSSPYGTANGAAAALSALISDKAGRKVRAPREGGYDSLSDR